MSAANESKVLLKILVDKERKKVIFAEADYDFVDILFSFLTLPLGRIVKLLRDEKLDSPAVSIGSFSSLYEGLKKLDPKHFWTGDYCKNMLLQPINSSESECQKLKVNVDGIEQIKYFICQEWNCSRSGSRSCYYSRHKEATCDCGKLLDREIRHESSVNTVSDSSVFVTKTSFIISDDLRVMPNLPSSCFELLNNAGIKDKKVVEEKTVSFCFKEFLYLLKCTLSSTTPLTDFIFRKKPFHLNSQVLPRTKTTSSSSSYQMTLKLVVLKSNKKVLFGQAEEDFIDFIFGFLTIPLGKVVSLLGVSTSLGCVDNLYKSVSDLKVYRHIISSPLKEKLISAKVAHYHESKNQIVSPYYYSPYNPTLHCYVDSSKPTDIKSCIRRSTSSNYGCSSPPMNLRDARYERSFVKGPELFMVTDDLVVTHSSSIAAFYFLNDMKIPVCDVEEQVVNIGLDEAFSILRASLHSESALTNGLSLLLKQPKQEP